MKIHSLRVKFVIAISSLVALVLLANGLVLALAGRRQLRQDIDRRALAFAQLAVGPICTAYETYYASGYSKFRELLLETIRLNPDLRRLVIYDTGGHSLFDSSYLQDESFPATSRPPAETLSAGMLSAIQGMSVTSWAEPAPEGGEQELRVLAPYVEEWGRHRYSVAFTVVYAGVGQAAKIAGWRIFWLSAGSLALGVLIAVVLSAQSLGPLEALSRGAQDFAGGRLERRIELQRTDEFGDLAATFNRMADRLELTISDLEASNRALERMNLDLQQVDRMKSDVLANVSHELRTPLTAIRGYTEAGQEGLLGPTTEQQREAFEVVRRNTHRLLGMIEQLLGFSRLEAGLAKLDMAPFDLVDAADQVVSAVRAARGQDAHLRLEVPPEGLPLVEGDAARISQVLENLVTNAVKFTPAGSEIRVTLHRRGDEVEVRVADRGIGIPASELANIFERFYQVDASSTRRYGGMGLGLAIVREILAAHHREIQVESRLGEGTTFRFTLPVASAAQPPVALPRAPREEKAS